MPRSSNGTSVFTSLRSRARSSFVGKHRLDVIVHSRLTDGPKYASLSVLKSAFAVAGLVLVEEEAEYLVKRFGDNRRRLDWGKLLVALDVAAPADFIDPDRSFTDELPQPYRLIVSVLDTEIVDRTWALIVERYPELATSPADEARAAADIDLGRSCPPSTRLQRPHPPLLLRGINEESTPSTAAEITRLGDSQGEDSLAAGSVENRAEVGEEPCLIMAPNENFNCDSRNGGGSKAAATPLTHEGRNGVTAVQWDRRGELMFTGGRDGSVCLRIDGTLEEIAVQIRGRGGGMCAATNGERGTPAAVAFLSRPVGALRVQSTRPSSVRIAAVLTPSTDGFNGGSRGTNTAEPGTGSEEKEEGGEDSVVTPLSKRPSHFVSVLEVALPIPGAGGGHLTSDAFAERGTVGGDIGRGTNNDSRSSRRSRNARTHQPTFRVICTVELDHKDAPVACALSPDGRRLALTTSGGRVATWMLPLFSPPSTVKGGKHAHVDSAANDEQGDRARAENGEGGDQERSDVDAGASLHEGTNSVDGEDDDLLHRAKLSTSSAVAGEVEAAAAAPAPMQLGRPEFGIPHLPSPEELAYAKALEEYSRRVKAGEIQEPALTPGGPEAEDGGSTPPPEAPQLSGDAYHLAHAKFVPAALGGGGGGSGGGGALSVWRSRSNVWRLHRLPPPDCSDVEGKQQQRGDESSVAAAVEATDEIAEQPDGDGGSNVCALLEPRLDVSTLPSAEWVLPSPVTASAVCEEEGEAVGCEWSCCGDSKGSALALPPLVAVGTENGGVYLCDGALGTAREGLSRHRARVTALAFHGKSFVVSGSDDEMIQIHHVSVAAAAAVGGGGGGRSGGCCAGGTPRLRCLHYARGSGIVRVACLQEIPLMFAEDTSGRMVAYDLPSGTVLGVLSAGGNSAASSSPTKLDDEDDGVGTGGPPSSARAASQKKAGVLWAAGGNNTAAVLRSVDEESSSTRLSTSPRRVGRGGECVENGGGGDGGGEALGVWSAADVMWGLSPGMRAIAEGVRPPGSRDVTRLFYDLLPAQRKDAEAKPDLQHLPLPSPSPPSIGHEKTNHFGRRATPPPTTASSTKTISFQLRSVKQEIQSRRDRPALTESNVDRLFTTYGAGCARAGVLGCGADARGTGGKAGGAEPWRGEMGAVERVRRAVDGRHGQRAARQIRLDNVTRNLLHAT